MKKFVSFFFRLSKPIQMASEPFLLGKRIYFLIFQFSWSFLCTPQHLLLSIIFCLAYVFFKLIKMNLNFKYTMKFCALIGHLWIICFRSSPCMNYALMKKCESFLRWHSENISEVTAQACFSFLSNVAVHSLFTSDCAL